MSAVERDKPDPDSLSTRSQNPTVDLAQDPLRGYSQEALIDLIEQQAAVLEETQVKSDHFERLYLDIIYSTSWKLAWPIRAAFKLLKALKDRLSNRARRTDRAGLTARVMQPQASQSAATDKAETDLARQNLLYFKTASDQKRLNLLISQPLETDQLQNALQQAARLAQTAGWPLRILTVDPLVTARRCRDLLSGPASRASSTPITAPTDSTGKTGFAGLRITHHTIAVPTGGRNDFRVDFCDQDHVLVLTDTAREFVGTFLAPENCHRIDPNDPHNLAGQSESWTQTRANLDNRGGQA